MRCGKNKILEFVENVPEWLSRTFARTEIPRRLITVVNPHTKLGRHEDGDNLAIVVALDAGQGTDSRKSWRDLPLWLEFGSVDSRPALLQTDHHIELVKRVVRPIGQKRIVSVAILAANRSKLGEERTINALVSVAANVTTITVKADSWRYLGRVEHKNGVKIDVRRLAINVKQISADWKTLVIKR